MNYGVTAPARIGQTMLPGGRRLAWAEWGPEDGTALLLCPGAATSRSLGFAGDLVDELGMRLVSVDRPGLGASDPDPDRTLSSWTTDIRHLTEVRKLDAPMAVGFSQGAPFALSLAADGVVSAVAVVSGSDELAHPCLSSLLDPQVKAIVDAVASGPEHAAASFAEFGSPDRLWELITATIGETDRAVYTDPVFQPVLQRAMREAFTQGPDGYARDTVLAMGRWPFDVERITVPADLWYGQQDTSPVHSPDHGATLAHRIPTATLHLLPDAAGSLLWTHADTVLRTLLRSREARRPSRTETPVEQA